MSKPKLKKRRLRGQSGSSSRRERQLQRPGPASGRLNPPLRWEKRGEAIDVAADMAGARHPTSCRLQIRNRQRSRHVDTPYLKRVLRDALDREVGVSAGEVCIHLVGAPEMTCLNETFLRHAGSTDVITFNQRERPSATELCGELFVCVDEAIALAPRFKSTWQAEILRYAIHGFLHLQGHDDHESAARRRMKREENRVLRNVGKRFAVTRIARKMPAIR